MHKQISKPSGVRSDEACKIMIEAEGKNPESLHISPDNSEGNLKNTGGLFNLVKLCRANSVKQSEETIVKVNGQG